MLWEACLGHVPMKLDKNGVFGPGGGGILYAIAAFWGRPVGWLGGVPIRVAMSGRPVLHLKYM